MGQRETLTAYKKNPNYGSKKNQEKNDSPIYQIERKKNQKSFQKKRKRNEFVEIKLLYAQ